MKRTKKSIMLAFALLTMMMLLFPAFTAKAAQPGDATAILAGNNNNNNNNNNNASTPATMQEVVQPVTDLIRTLAGPVLGIVGALGTVYCIILGVKFAKAEEPQDREKAKAHLKNAIIGFVLIFVMLVVLSRVMPYLVGWVTKNQVTQTNYNIFIV